MFRQLVFALFVASAHSEHDAAGLQAMSQVFARSAEAHQESMNEISKGMSTPNAVKVLEQGSMNSPALMQVASLAMGKQSSLRKQTPKKGYSGIDGARKLLNDMIYESMSKYDAEVAKCTEYYSKQCAAMESCRGQIAASNYIAANSRSLILDSQATINKCEVDIPTRKLELKQHLLGCKHELEKMNARLKIVLGDIKVMTMILEMTDCEKKLLQVEQMQQCTNQCTHKSFIQFHHDGLQQKLNQLQSSTSKQLISDTFADLFEGIEALESVEFLQLDSQQAPVINKTQFNNPPTPRTVVPSDPCTDPAGGAPDASTKRAAKCTITKSPQCYKLQERFLLIQSGIKDERDDLLDQISTLENYCKETKESLETQIANDETMLNNAQTKLAGATEKEATAGETARQTAAENEQLNDDLEKQMKTCSANYVNFETELCALKKIRGELYKMKGGGHSAFFQDCEVSKWDPEECTKKCNTGEQKLTRSVLTHPNGGAKCLPLAALKSCNNQPCPVDCRLAAWSGWAKCSADCGGGVSQRLREVKRAMRYGGKPCGPTSQEVSCNNQACERDCELSPWSKWSACSKDCDGGTRKRQKFIKEAAQGAGKCAGKWSLKRLQYEKCNMFTCTGASAAEAHVCNTYENDPNGMFTCEDLPTCCDGHEGMGLTATTIQCLPSSWKSDSAYKVKCGEKAMPCKAMLDVVFLLDGSGSMGTVGWAAQIKAAQTFVDSFSGTGAQAEMSVILYSGPRTWAGVRLCFGRNKKKVDQKATCKINMVTHFTHDMKKVKQLITGLTWPKGSTLTSLALLAAKSELALGRKDAKSVVVTITDGRPLSYRATSVASRIIRKSARLVWVPVTRYAPLKWIKRWATRRWQENVVRVKDFTKLEDPEIVTHVVANICPK